MVLLYGLCLSFKAVITSCEVVSVSRNVTDSFRVGKQGCTNNVNICTSSATCQADGSCLCHSKTPTYRNPVIECSVNKTLEYGHAYGCSKDEHILRRVLGGKSPISDLQSHLLYAITTIFCIL